VLIEAMANGTPVIAFGRGSVPEIIDHGVTGFIVDSVDEAVAAIPLAKTLDRRAIRRRFEERFSVKRSLCRIGSIPALAAVRQSRRLTDATRKTPDRREAGIIGGGLSALGGIASAAGSGQTSCEAHRRGGRSISGNIAGSGIPPVDQILSRRRLARMNDPYTAINCNCWASKVLEQIMEGTRNRSSTQTQTCAAGVRSASRL
jgi:hypothetical protein